MNISRLRGSILYSSSSRFLLLLLLPSREGFRVPTQNRTERSGNKALFLPLLHTHTHITRLLLRTRDQLSLPHHLASFGFRWLICPKPGGEKKKVTDWLRFSLPSSSPPRPVKLSEEWPGSWQEGRQKALLRHLLPPLLLPTRAGCRCHPFFFFFFSTALVWTRSSLRA